MKRDRKKGSRPEYEDLLYDETPSVVVYYPSRGGDDESSPEPTVRRDRSTAFVPDLAELEPLTREQPALEAEAAAVTELFPGRAEPAVDPAKPVPANLQNRGVLAWDPTHRDPGGEDSFNEFFRPESAEEPRQAPAAAAAPLAPAPAPVAAKPPAHPARPAAAAAPAARVEPTANPASAFRPVVFETDIIAADFIEADAIRADPPAAPVRQTIVEERPTDDDLEFDEDEAADGLLQEPAFEAPDEDLDRAVPIARPVEVVAVAAQDPTPPPAEPEPAQMRSLFRDGESSSAAFDAVALESVALDSSNRDSVNRDSVNRDSAGSSFFDDEPDTQMRFLQEWEADVTGTHEAQVNGNHTGRLFRSLRAHPQPETLPALRRDQAARFKSLSSSQDSGPVPFPSRPPVTASVIDEDPQDAYPALVPAMSADQARIWTASSMSGLKPGLVYLIPLVATLVVGIANALFLGPGIGWPTGVALLLSSVFGALRVRLVDASVAVIAPPLALLAAAAIAGQIGMGMAGGPVIGAASNLFFALSTNVLWLVGATVASLLVVVVRTRRDRA